jgi:hypothetical protein
MIKIVHTEVRVSGIEMVQRFHDPGRLESYLAGTMSKQMAHFLLEEKMISITSKYDPHDDHNTYRATLHVATEEDYREQVRGVGPIEPYSEEASRLEQYGYERGVRVALALVATKANSLKDDRLKKNQHAAAILIETAIEVEEELI